VKESLYRSCLDSVVVLYLLLVIQSCKQVLLAYGDHMIYLLLVIQSCKQVLLAYGDHIYSGEKPPVFRCTSIYSYGRLAKDCGVLGQMNIPIKHLFPPTISRVVSPKNSKTGKKKRPK